MAVKRNILDMSFAVRDHGIVNCNLVLPADEWLKQMSFTTAFIRGTVSVIFFFLSKSSQD